MRKSVAKLDKRVRALSRSAARQYPRRNEDPPITKRMNDIEDPAACERCLAVYTAKTWRAAGPTRRVPADVHWTLCPACSQVEELEYFGRVRVTQPLDDVREADVRRRIYNVERRARATQPERRMVRLGRTSGGLEVLTTSQKLAHRIARELEKAFGGRAHYVWTEPEGLLDATWDPAARRRSTPGTSRRHGTKKLAARSAKRTARERAR